MATKDDSILIPLKLDAFVFNRGVCDGKPPPKGPTKPHLHPTAAKIAPISQPNYTFLRLDHDYIQPDILNPVKLRNTWPAEYISRFTDLYDDENRLYEARQGVYLHWTLSRLYRSSIVAADKKAAISRAHAEALEARGLTPHGDDLTGKDGDKEPAMTGEPVWDGLESSRAEVGDTRGRPGIKRLVAEFVAQRPVASPPESPRPLEMPIFNDRLIMGDKVLGQKGAFPKACGEGKQEAFGNDGLWRNQAMTRSHGFRYS